MNKLSSNLGFSNIVDLSRGANMPTSFFWKKMVEEMLLLLKSMIKRRKKQTFDGVCIVRFKNSTLKAHVKDRIGCSNLRGREGELSNLKP